MHRSVRYFGSSHSSEELTITVGDLELIMFCAFSFDQALVLGCTLLAGFQLTDRLSLNFLERHRLS